MQLTYNLIKLKYIDSRGSENSSNNILQTFTIFIDLVNGISEVLSSNKEEVLRITLPIYNIIMIESDSYVTGALVENDPETGDCRVIASEDCRAIASDVSDIDLNIINYDELSTLLFMPNASQGKVVIFLTVRLGDMTYTSPIPVIEISTDATCADILDAFSINLG